MFAEIPQRLPEELFQTLLEKPGVRIERIVSNGHRSPENFWYDQEQDEWVLLLQGKAKLGFCDRASVELNPGDYLMIPAHQRHRVEWTPPDSTTVWLAIHIFSPAI